MKLEIPITVEFDDMWEMVDEIKSLQTYKLSEDDDMLLVDREDVADILARHAKAKTKQLDGLPSAQPEIIRCKDCKHYEGGWYCSAWNNSPGFPMVTEEGYCDLAERREE